MTRACLISAALLALAATACAEDPVELFPSADRLHKSHPRLLLRGERTAFATGVGDLKILAATKAGQEMLARVRSRADKTLENAAMLALVTGEKADVDAALRMLANYKVATEGRFRAFFQLRSVALAYDWLYNEPGFTDAAKKAVRDKCWPLAAWALREATEAGAHCFHNYMYMDACGIAFASIAFATEDERFAGLLTATRKAWNTQYFPALKYLGGVPGEPMGYWGNYCLRTTIHTVRAINSAFDVDGFAVARERHDDFLGKHIEYVAYATMPNLRYVRFGDSTDGPDGGATHEMADVIDAAADLCKSPTASWFSRRMEEVRGAARYYQATAPYWFCWGGDPTTKFDGPPRPVSRVFQSADGGGHAFLRGGWGPSDLVVAFRCTDHYGAHNHYDQGSFTLWRQGPLAIDVGKYGGPGKKVRGPQQATHGHNTLLIDGRGQRKVHGQSSGTIAHFRSIRYAGPKLATGKILAFKTTPKADWVVGDFTDAYAADQASKVQRALVLLKPDTVVVIDLVQTDKKVEWLLHVPKTPTVNTATATVTATNGKSGLICRTLMPGSVSIAAGEILARPVIRVSPKASDDGRVTLVHLLRTSKTPEPPSLPKCVVSEVYGTLRLEIGDRMIAVPLDDPASMVVTGK